MNKLILCSLSLLISYSAQCQSVLFDTTDYTTNNAFPSLSLTDGFNYADDVSISAGGEITSIQVDFTGFADTASADLTFRFYDDNGASGAPGSQLGSDITLNNVIFTDNSETFAISIIAAVPNIVVDNDFYWAFEVSNLNVTGPILPFVGVRRADDVIPNPAGASTDSSFYYQDSGSGFQRVDDQDNNGTTPRTYGVQLLAVPEAGTFSLAALGLFVIAGIRRFIQRDR